MYILCVCVSVSHYHTHACMCIYIFMLEKYFGFFLTVKYKQRGA